MANVVIVVDTIRGFLEEGYPLSCGPESRRIIPHVRALLERELAAGSRLLFVRDAHVPEDPELARGVWPPHCMKGSIESEIIPELDEFVARGELFEKHAYSGFSSPEFAARVEELKPDKLIVVGVCTDVCVLHTVADALWRQYPVEVPEAGVSSLSEENHRFGLAHLRNALGAKEPAGREARVG